MQQCGAWTIESAWRGQNIGTNKGPGGPQSGFDAGMDWQVLWKMVAGNNKVIGLKNEPVNGIKRREHNWEWSRSVVVVKKAGIEANIVVAHRGNQTLSLWPEHFRVNQR